MLVLSRTGGRTSSHDEDLARTTATIGGQFPQTISPANVRGMSGDFLDTHHGVADSRSCHFLMSSSPLTVTAEALPNLRDGTLPPQEGISPPAKCSTSTSGTTIATCCKVLRSSWTWRIPIGGEPSRPMAESSTIFLDGTLSRPTIWSNGTILAVSFRQPPKRLRKSSRTSEASHAEHHHGCRAVLQRHRSRRGSPHWLPPAPPAPRSGGFRPAPF